MQGGEGSFPAAAARAFFDKLVVGDPWDPATDIGPVIRGADADLADAVIEAIEADNPGADVMVEDAGGYIRISVPQRCRLRSTRRPWPRRAPLCSW